MTGPEPCIHCGGSGVLNIVATSQRLGEWDETGTASPCHACPAGRVWTEVGLDA